MKNSGITSRERVKLALRHGETDRVPVDFQATPESWAGLKKYLGLQGQESIMKLLGADVRHPRLRYIGPPLKKHSDGGYTDVWGITWSPVPHKGGFYYEISKHPLEKIQDAGALKDYPWPDPVWWDLNSLVEQIALWDKETEYAICMDDFGDPGGFYEIANYMRGMEQFLMDMAISPDISFEIIGHITDFFIALAEEVLAILGDRVDLIWSSDDIAHQHGLMMSQSMWRQLLFPHHERFNRCVHELGGCIMYHSCGSVMAAIPGLIEMGIDVLDVLQFSADNMNPEDLKSNYGDKLCFHGGADVQQLLPRSTESEVRKTIRHIIKVMGKGGGFILSPSHAVQVDTPPANILAIYREAGSLTDKQP